MPRTTCYIAPSTAGYCWGFNHCQAIQPIDYLLQYIESTESRQEYDQQQLGYRLLSSC